VALSTHFINETATQVFGISSKSNLNNYTISLLSKIRMSWIMALEPHYNNLKKKYPLMTNILKVTMLCSQEYYHKIMWCYDSKICIRETIIIMTYALKCFNQTSLWTWRASSIGKWTFLFQIDNLSNKIICLHDIIQYYSMGRQIISASQNGHHFKKYTTQKQRLYVLLCLFIRKFTILYFEKPYYSLWMQSFYLNGFHCRGSAKILDFVYNWNLNIKSAVLNPLSLIVTPLGIWNKR